MLKDLVFKTRSYRRFDQSVSVDMATLRELVDLARLSASGANRQPLKFILSNEPEKNARIFACLHWAGYLKGWTGPAEGERPTAYIIILGDTDLSKAFGVNHGIAAQSMMLGAVEKGLGGCMVGAIDTKPLRASLHISEQYEILLVLALGKPVEKIIIDPVGEGGDIKYLSLIHISEPTRPY